MFDGFFTTPRGTNIIKPLEVDEQLDAISFGEAHFAGISMFIATAN